MRVDFFANENPGGRLELIASDMHGQKKRRKRSIEGAASIDGLPLHWELISEPQWSNTALAESGVSGFKGLCISVRLEGPARRELIIEFPFPAGKGHPVRPPISPPLVETAIRQALDGGWDPQSRGKPFLFHAPDPYRR